MSELFREVDEALTYDRMHALWRRYRIVVVATLALVLASLAAWQGWQANQQKKRAQAAETFFALLAQDVTDSKTPQLTKEQQETLQGGYRTMWFFLRAKKSAQNQEWQKARMSLQQATEDRSLQPLYRHYAQIWQASLEVQQGRLEEAATLLETLNAQKAGGEVALQGLALYLQAAVKTAQGDKEAAKKILTHALTLGNLAPTLQERLQQAARAIETETTEPSRLSP